MSAAALLNTAGFVVCCIVTARAAVDAAFAYGLRARIDCAIIGAISLVGVISFLARAAMQGLA